MKLSWSLSLGIALKKDVSNWRQSGEDIENEQIWPVKKDQRIFCSLAWGRLMEHTIIAAEWKAAINSNTLLPGQSEEDKKYWS